jgi:hypothetical protein
MNAAAFPWGALLTESATLFLLLLSFGLGLIGIWNLWSQGPR